MKHVYTLTFALFLFINAYTQTVVCPTSVDMVQMQINEPTRYNRFMALEAFTANYINSQSSSRLTDANGVIKIPVVVHILHRGENIGNGRNLSDAQIQSQIDVLNEDFRRLNADRINTPSSFLGVAADFGLEFKLACQDANGYATTGIVRKHTNKGSYDYIKTGASVDEAAMGIKMTNISGSDPWPTDRYLNIWVCKFSSTAGIVGYSTFPGDFVSKPNVDGIVIDCEAFGRTGTAKAPYNKGRAATHEIGHWLNLKHIWGDAICGDDYVADTPPQEYKHTGCPSGIAYSYCSNQSTEDMFMNYMDNTDDACKNIFSTGQRLRGRAVFAAGGPRASFIDNYFRILPVANTIFCNGIIKLTNPTCLPVIWSVISGSATVSLGNLQNQAVLQATGTGSVLLRAKAGNFESDATINVEYIPKGSGTYYYTSNSTVGTSALGASNSQLIPPNQSMSFNIYLSTTGLSNINWSNSGYSVLYNASGTTVDFSMSAPSTAYTSRTTTFTLNATTPCGQIVNQTFSFTLTASGWSKFDISVSPNPAKGIINVITKDIYGIKQLSASENIVINIYNLNRTSLVKQWHFQNNQKQFILNVYGLQEGLYVIEVIKGGFRQSRQIIIEQ